MKEKNKHLWLKAFGICFFLVVFLLLIKSEFVGELSKMLNEGTVEDLVFLIKGFGIWAPLISMGLMILQAFIAPIPAFLISGANGVIFGFFWGSIISWSGAMLGAAGTYYLSRFLGEAFVKKIKKSSDLMDYVDKMSSKHGFKIILIARLLPFVSFDFISYAAGLSTIKSRDFFIATGLGMIPGTLVYVLLGSEIFKLSTYSMPLTLSLSGLVIILLWLYNYWNKKRNKNDETKKRNTD